MIKPMATFNGYLNVAEEGSRPKTKRKGMKHSQNDSGRGKREREKERANAQFNCLFISFSMYLPFDGIQNR